MAGSPLSVVETAGMIPDPRPNRFDISSNACVQAQYSSRRIRPSVLFEFLVNRTIEGKPLARKRRAAGSYPSPPYKPEATNIRTDANTVRRLIERYYATDGLDDFVVISVPAQPSFKDVRRDPRKEEEKKHENGAQASGWRII